MLKTNEKKIVEFLIQCQAGQPKTKGNWGIDHLGKPYILPGIGGITLNIQIGDPAFGWAGDHLEPGVSCSANPAKPYEYPNPSLQVFACTGNKVKVISGDAKGSVGTVIGHHGGSEHVIVEFSRKVKEKLTYQDHIMVYAKGQGLALKDFEDVILFNLDPELLKKMKIKVLPDNSLQVPVTTLVPAACMGSGVGAGSVASGDYDIMTSDPESMKEYKLDQLRFGDFVALLDHDNRYGRAYRKGAVTIGIVIHSDCKHAGHGPGITTLMTCDAGQISPVLDPKANIAHLLKIGTEAKSK